MPPARDAVLPMVLVVLVLAVIGELASGSSLSATNEILPDLDSFEGHSPLKSHLLAKFKPKIWRTVHVDPKTGAITKTERQFAREKQIATNSVDPSVHVSSYSVTKTVSSSSEDTDDGQLALLDPERLFASWFSRRGRTRGFLGSLPSVTSSARTVQSPILSVDSGGRSSNSITKGISKLFNVSHGTYADAYDSPINPDNNHPNGQTYNNNRHQDHSHHHHRRHRNPNRHHNQQQQHRHDEDY